MQDFAARHQHVGECPQQRDRVGHPVQDPHAQHHVEAFTELAHVQRVHPLVLDARGEELGDSAEAGTARSVMPKRARTHSTYCSLSTATTRRAPRPSARKL